MRWNLSLFPLPFLFVFSFSASSDALIQNTNRVGENEGAELGFSRRALLSFKESPHGTNVTFECSRSGPCVACLYAEKNDGKYRCSETGYRIPLKCVETKDTLKVSKDKKSQDGRSTLEMSNNHELESPELNGAIDDTSSVGRRNLLVDSHSAADGSQSYITYRSCIPSVNEERLSVLGFESIVLFLLLVSGSAVYFRRKRTVSTAGFAAGRVQSNSRF